MFFLVMFILPPNRRLTTFKSPKPCLILSFCFGKSSAYILTRLIPLLAEDKFNLVYPVILSNNSGKPLPPSFKQEIIELLNGFHSTQLHVPGLVSSLKVVAGK